MGGLLSCVQDVGPLCLCYLQKTKKRKIDRGRVIYIRHSKEFRNEDIERGRQADIDEGRGSCHIIRTG